MGTGNILGERFVVVSFGESHGRCVGVVIDGCPAGLEISEEDIQMELDRRRPGQSILTTQRREQDRVEILSGVFNGRTTGAPICMLVWNRDVDSSPYLRILNKPRPGHADYVARVKYGGFNDWRGGGRFSARVTAGYVMAGAVAKKLLSKTLGIEVMAYTKEIGGVVAGELPPEVIRERRYANDVRCPDEEAAKRMTELILKARGEGDSLGGVVECIALNVPVGLGEPVFSSLDSDLARVLFSIPAVKGVEFGAGFRASRMRGSEHNDPYVVRNGRVETLTNNSGGVVGGISNGMPIVVRAAFKPVSSIAKPQRTVDLEKMRETEIIIPGRHDPVVVPRAVPIVEAVVAITLADHAVRAGFIKNVVG
ncbi:MAG TPA: chorismate synthase [Candidatus Caldiarchaeum subterraneum]|uniref:Chorismate synthase n=1 Tax=Caldiarchaeum subterraneum TaxID=311458 RepID=A0A832ZWL9_CALS0|nr:chorismate synthase [Candidatus Caldarchaeum subterraneum]